MNLKRLLFASIFAVLFLFLTACGGSNNTSESENKKDTETKTEEKAEPKDLILATTTSTQDSGLLDELIPLFEEEHNYNVKTIAVGTGQALEMGTKGEADVLLVHAPKKEKEKEEAGDVINRKRVMFNDYIVLGPTADPAGVKGLSVKEAFQKILDNNAIFISRGDESGTHTKEIDIWKSIGVNIDPKNPSAEPPFQAYKSAGTGMGATLTMANQEDGYVLTDRATFLAQKDNLTHLSLVVESKVGEEDLLNIYHVMQVNPEKNDKINAEGAEKFVDFMVSEDTLKVIEEFGKDKYGQPLFFPYAE